MTSPAAAASVGSPGAARVGRLVARIAGAAWYPLLLAVAWFLEVWISARVEPAAALRGLLLTICAAGLVTVVLTLLMGRERGAFAAAIAIVGLIGIRDAATIVPFLAVIPLLLLERRWAAEGRIRLPWPRIHEALTIVTLVMLAIQVFRLATLGSPAPKASSDAWDPVVLAPGDRPSIYLVLADAHARSDVLRDWYAYDDAPTRDALQELGFDVAAGSRANYLLTRFSLASMLTASYLTELHDGRHAGADAYAAATVAANPTFPLLRRAGYEVVVVSSGYEHLGLRSADRFIDTGQPNELEDALTGSTAVGRLALALNPDLVLAGIRDRTLAQLEVVREYAADPGPHPRFVIAHLPVPHWPYAFDADCGPADSPGEPASPAEPDLRLGSPEQVRLVREQTQCVDRLLQDALRDLVAADPDAVVVLFSDHGPQEYFDPVAPTDAELLERSANLFAARTPGRPDLFPDDVTLVNVMPILLNAYLGTDLPLQANQSWFGPSARDGTFTPVAAAAP